MSSRTLPALHIGYTFYAFKNHSSIFRYPVLHEKLRLEWTENVLKV